MKRIVQGDLIITVGLFISLLLATYRVDAAVEVFSISEAPIPVNYTDRELQIGQFDPSLGRLESITIEVQATGIFTQLFEHIGRSDGDLVTNGVLCFHSHSLLLCFVCSSTTDLL